MTEQAKINAEKRKDREQKQIRMDKAIVDTCLMILESDDVDLSDKMLAIQIMRERNYRI